jgi:murein DD-endopeptidase MepM/ murein hydrolase activator NlpD
MDNQVKQAKISKNTINWLYRGLETCRPELLIGLVPGADKFEKKYEYGHYTSKGFTKILIDSVTPNLTSKELKTNLEQTAAKKVVEWKNNTGPIDATVPEKLNELTELEETGDETITEEGKRLLAQKAITDAEQFNKAGVVVSTVGDVAPEYSPTGASNSYVLLRITDSEPKEGSPTINKLQSLPGRTGVNAGGFKSFEKSREGTTALWAISRGITGKKLLSALSQAESEGIGLDATKIRRLALLIEDQKSSHFYRKSTLSYNPNISFSQTNLNQTEISTLLSTQKPSSNEIILASTPQSQTYFVPQVTFSTGFVGSMGTSFVGNISSRLIGAGIKKASKALASTIVKEGAKSAAKTGAIIAVEGALTTAEAATGPPGWLVMAIEKVLTAIIVIGKKAISWVKNLLVKEENKDMRRLAYFGLVVGGASLAVAVPTGIAQAAGVLMTGTGVVGLAGESVAAAGGISGVASAASTSSSAFIGAITAISLATLAPIAIAVVAVPIIIALMLFLVNATSYVVPPTLTSIVEADRNPYISVTKTANPAGNISPTNIHNEELNDEGLEVEYTITISSKKGRLTNVTITEECEVSKENTNGPTCPKPNPDIPSSPPNNEILPGQAFTFTYIRKYSGKSFYDSAVTDVVTVTANSIDVPNQSESDSAVLCFGNCPVDCPSGSPIRGSHPITQGPRGTYSHTSYGGHEAIDIGTSSTTMYATHSGKVVYAGWADGGWGNQVLIQSLCEGNVFTSRYAHMSSVAVGVGQEVIFGQRIGRSGNTGNSSGPHVHYGFYGPNGVGTRGPEPNNPPYMWPIYIPNPGISRNSFYGCPGGCGTIQ